jgi:hypothetical protein
MVRLTFALLLMLPLAHGFPQVVAADDVWSVTVTEQSTDDSGELPNAPSALRQEMPASASPRIDSGIDFSLQGFSVSEMFPLTEPAAKPKSVQVNLEREPYHWKGLLLQSFGFSALENTVRIMTANQHDRHILLNKPYWSDYWSSLQQFNMRRWNDGDSFPVNYIGHPMQGAISGYIEIQNDPKARGITFSNSPLYWKNVGKAFLWATVYSTHSEIGPMGEAAVFNEGGFTYPIRCPDGDSSKCPPNATYTNNTGWVDFIVTPTIGMVWMVGEDAVDKYVSDPLVHNHPDNFGYKLMRAGLNPSRSLANILRLHYPWFRDEEHFANSESAAVRGLDRAMEERREEAGDLYLHYSAHSLGVNTGGCYDCRDNVIGAGMRLGIAWRKYLEFIADVGVKPGASPESSLNVGGSLVTANFGIRSGYSGERFALKVSLAPGFASYSNSQPLPSESDPNPETRRNFNFSTMASVEGDIRFGPHFAMRMSLEQLLIRYKSTMRDPAGIGTPPWLSFLSHDNYINSTNWGTTVGPVFRF